MQGRWLVLILVGLGFSTDSRLSSSSHPPLFSPPHLASPEPLLLIRYDYSPTSARRQVLYGGLLLISIFTSTSTLTLRIYYMLSYSDIVELLSFLGGGHYVIIGLGSGVHPRFDLSLAGYHWVRERKKKFAPAQLHWILSIWMVMPGLDWVGLDWIGLDWITKTLDVRGSDL